MRVSSNPLYSILAVALLVSACATQAELRVDAMDAIKRVIDFLSAYPVDDLLLEGNADSVAPKITT